MNNKIYASCTAYSFWQCYDSDIEVLEDLHSDADKLRCLQALAAAYSAATADMCAEDLQWSISAEQLAAVAAATALSDLDL